jgi:hypothetical protein
MPAMSTFPIAVIAAVSTLLPISILAALGRLERNALGWLLLAAAVIGGSLPAIAELQSRLARGLAASLDVTAPRCLVVFAAAVILNACALRLPPWSAPMRSVGRPRLVASPFEAEPPLPARRAPGSPAMSCSPSAPMPP